MVDVPERIWAASVTENYGEWQTTTDGLPRPTEYIRADLVAELAAENERLTKLADGLHDEVQFMRQAVKENREALSRTGAVNALSWSIHPAGGEQALGAGLGLYRIHENGDDWYLVPDHMGTGGKAAAQADYERRILSALAEPAGEVEPLSAQIERLASFIMEHVPGEPSQSEGAVDCAIRVIRNSLSTPPGASAIREALEAVRALSGLDGELCKASATIMSRMADIHQTADAALAGAKP